ncbi:hypothetical protein NIES2119_16005 [[Phormidium ambiguum] IAM M-71]|uniref:Uncharacterized protein n=1 Tax=[Phormidium ambiguum] IAM M-71 TaxID=454136 RepID=A0A1U7IHL2_9CYAN|nr:hypothetical protein [Phormidium ambiguum]OKH36543.1 hypothetical protein NIES2119_16005 [Phormidium ambiguum IAM M-71]
MSNLIANTTNFISDVLKKLQVQRFLAVVLVGFLLLTTNVDSGRNNKGLPQQIDQIAHDRDSVRPKTTREWEKEKRETENSPGERLGRIGKESAKAFEEFGSGYVKGAKETANQAKEAGREILP